MSTLNVLLPNKIPDASGNVVKRIDYDSFGNIIDDTDPTFEVPFGFAGGLHDRDTGLVRFGYRDYDPNTGRWTAKDPILFASGDIDLYGYCLNNPTCWVDQYGLQGMNDFARQWGIGESFTGAVGNVWSQTARQADSSHNAAESYRERSIKHEKTGDRAHFYAEFFGSAPYDSTGGYIPLVLVPAEAALANYYYGLSEYE